MGFVKSPEQFSFEEPNAPQRWVRWEKQFTIYFTAAELETKSKEVQVARLLNAAEAEALTYLLTMGTCETVAQLDQRC